MNRGKIRDQLSVRLCMKCHCCSNGDYIDDETKLLIKEKREEREREALEEEKERERAAKISDSYNGYLRFWRRGGYDRLSD